jgi:Protein of unknown function (DUF1566)
MVKIILALCLTLNASAQTLKSMKRLPDSGQTTSYTANFGEDNDYSVNEPSFIFNNNGTITDTITELMWQSADGGEMTVEAAKIYCDSFTLSGYTNWRLPTAQEAFSILNLDKNNPALNTLYFPNTNADYWWTSEFQVNDSTKIWCTNAGGGIGNHPKMETISAGGSKKFHARAVRDVATPIIIANHFTDNADGTITDNITNLMWEKVPSATAQTWENAITEAENLLLATYSDWRLPNIKELQSLNDEAQLQPSVTAPFFTSLFVKKYWSSTSLPNQTNKAWYWHNAFGVTTYDNKLNLNNFLCVRNNSIISSLIIKNTEISKIVIYPNPFEDYIKIAFIDANELIIMTNQIGNIIYCGKNIQQQDFSELPSGNYYLKIKSIVLPLIKK